MADVSPQEQIMPLPLTKRMLSMAEKEPLGCALGMTKDKKECLLLIDKNAKAKKVATKLRAEGKATLDVVTMRFGKVDFDIENDPGTVRFTVNRDAAGGTHMALVRLAKRAGYQAVVINVDPELEKESENDDATAATEAASQPTAADTATPSPVTQEPAAVTIDAAALKARLTALVKRMIARIGTDPSHKDEMMALARDGQSLLGANDLEQASVKADALEAILDSSGAPSAGLDAAALKARLTDAVKHMIARIATDPTHKDEMMALAKDAQGLLGANNLEATAAKIGALETLLNGAPNTAGAKGNFVKMQQSRLMWEAARKKVAEEIDRFKQAVEADFQDDDDELDILDGLDRLDEILLHLDDRLTDTLDDMLDERTPAQEHEKLLAEAKGLIGEYEAFAGSDPLMSKLEGDTPFGMKLSIASTVTKTLQSLRATIH